MESRSGACTPSRIAFYPGRNKFEMEEHSMRWWPLRRRRPTRRYSMDSIIRFHFLVRPRCKSVQRNPFEGCRRRRYHKQWQPTKRSIRRFSTLSPLTFVGNRTGFSSSGGLGVTLISSAAFRSDMRSRTDFSLS